VLDAPDATAAFWRLTEDPGDPYTPAELEQTPPVLVVPFSNKAAYLARYAKPDMIAAGLSHEEAWPVPYWDVDAGMAAMLLMLAAIDEGLAAWVFAVFDGERELMQHFGVPDDFRIVGVVGMGYGAPEDTMTAQLWSSRTKLKRPVSERLHRNGW